MKRGYNMPYIDKDRRSLRTPKTAGELNFKITKVFIRDFDKIIRFDHRKTIEDVRVIIKKYIDSKPERYQVYNDVFGAVTCALLEFERRGDIGNQAKSLHGHIEKLLLVPFYHKVVAPYEDKAISRNGDVY